jgi:hypothetical protein
MSKFIGRLVHVGIAKEAVRGTALDPVFWLPKMEFSHDDKIQQVVDESSLGVIEDAEDASVTQKFSEGKLKGRIETESFGLWLLSTLGASAPTLVETGVYDHLFTVGQTAQHPSLTVSVKDPNSGVGLRYALSMIDSLEINAELNKYVEFNASFRGNSNVSDAVTPAYVSQSFFMPQHGEFKIATDLVGLGVASPISIKRANFTISKNIEDDQVLGNVEVVDRLNKHFVIEGTIELIYEDRSFIDTIFLGDLQKAMQIKFTNTDVTIGIASHPTLTVDFAKVKFSEVARTQDNNEIVRQTLSFKSFYSTADAKSVEATLRNITVSY